MKKIFISFIFGFVVFFMASGQELSYNLKVIVPPNWSGWCFVFCSTQQKTLSDSIILNNKGFACIDSSYLSQIKKIMVFRSNEDITDEYARMLQIGYGGYQKGTVDTFAKTYFYFYVMMPDEKKYGNDYWNDIDSTSKYSNTADLIRDSLLKHCACCKTRKQLLYGE